MSDAKKIFEQEFDDDGPISGLALFVTSKGKERLTKLAAAANAASEEGEEAFTERLKRNMQGPQLIDVDAGSEPYVARARRVIHFPDGDAD